MKFGGRPEAAAVAAVSVPLAAIAVPADKLFSTVRRSIVVFPFQGVGSTTNFSPILPARGAATLWDFCGRVVLRYASWCQMQRTPFGKLLNLLNHCLLNGTHNAGVEGSIPSLSTIQLRVRSGHIGNGYCGHIGDTLAPKGFLALVTRSVSGSKNPRPYCIKLTRTPASR